MNAVMVIPTGIGCEIGGHAGDANPYAKLLASCCETLVVHPNVVNASDLNEMTENMLYVEGSTLDRFLRGEIFLEDVYTNKILLVVNNPVDVDTINAVNAAKNTLGAEIDMITANVPFLMTGCYDKYGKAAGEVTGWRELIEQLDEYDFDALAIQTNIQVERETKLHYLTHGGVNPWGGVEAIASKLLAEKLDKPVAHAPYVNWQEGQDDLEDFNEIVDQRLAAEMVSMCYIHCIFKGLHQAPRISYETGLSVDKIDVLVTPIDCFGPPHRAALEQGIKVIAVRENKNVCKDPMPDEFIIVDTYLEAAGLMQAMNAGVNLKQKPCLGPLNTPPVITEK